MAMYAARAVSPPNSRGLTAMFLILSAIFGGRNNAPHDQDYYRRLVAEHLHFIENRCYKAYGLTARYHTYEDAPGANRADALVVEVLDHIKADDYKVLREYKGRASLTRYLEVVISNKVIDLYRGREGRSRASEEARKMGEAGVRLYELVFKNGMPVEQAHNIMAAEHGYAGSVEELEEMAGRIRARQRPAHTEVAMGAYRPQVEDGPSRLKVVMDETGGLTVPDASPGPEQDMVREQTASARAGALKDIARSLSPEERLMVKLRYGDGMKVKDIAGALGITEKNAYRRFELMLARCRELLAKKCLTLDDLL